MAAKAHMSRRRHYFIKKDFQVRFILKFCLLLLAGIIVSTALLFLFSQDTLTSSFNNSKLVIEKTAFAIMPSVIYTNLITLGLILIASIAVTLFVSHKLAGPMYRIETDLEIIGKGDLTKIVRIRKKDQLESLVVSINNMTQSLHDKMAEVQTDIENLCSVALDNEVGEEMKKSINDLSIRLKQNFIL